MSIYFFDSSAVVKRYFPEGGSEWVKVIMDLNQGHTIVLAEITRVEVAAATAAKQRASDGITLADRDAALKLWLRHCDTEYQMVPSTPAVISYAVGLTQRHRLRAYDAVQLATAVLVNNQYSVSGLAPLILISADHDLINAARAEGLSAENPLSHL